jgi:hypothetical protein
MEALFQSRFVSIQPPSTSLGGIPQPHQLEADPADLFGSLKLHPEDFGPAASRANRIRERREQLRKGRSRKENACPVFVSKKLDRTNDEILSSLELYADSRAFLLRVRLQARCLPVQEKLT